MPIYGAGNNDDVDDQDLRLPQAERILKITNVNKSIPAQVPITIKEGINVIDSRSSYFSIPQYLLNHYQGWKQCLGFGLYKICEWLQMVSLLPFAFENLSSKRFCPLHIFVKITTLQKKWMSNKEKKASVK